LLKAYAPAIDAALGVFIPLIVVNCIIFGRAEAYASKHAVVPSFFDGIGMGLGFTCAITGIGLVRELIGSGTVFNIQILGEGTVIPGSVGKFLALYQPVRIFVMQAGAFFVLACLIAIMNRVKRNMAAKGKDTSKFGVGGCCTVNAAGAPVKINAQQKEEDK